jgi:hypothetical protein
MENRGQSAAKLIYIMGYERSGSTVFSIVLGNHPAIASVGELHKWPLFEGRPKPGDTKSEDHLFWKSVLEAYLCEGRQPEFTTLVDLQGEFENYRNFIKLYLGLVPKRLRFAYSQYFLRLLRAIQSVTGNEIIVDETKRPGRALFLLRYSNLDVKIIHLVRDPRGVVYSQMKTDVEHRFKSPQISIFHYLIKNTMSEIVRLSAPRGTVLRVRYEDLVGNPASELARIGKFLGISMEPVIAKIISNGPLNVPHLIDGNQIRRNSAITIRFDAEWRSKLPKVYQIGIILFTLPFFLLYGYWDYPYKARMVEKGNFAT